MIGGAGKGVGTLNCDESTLLIRDAPKLGWAES
jgi:hypothetical protein